MKIVINTCYGGFGLSEKAYLRLIELGIPLVDFVEGQNHDGKILRNTKELSYMGPYWDTWLSQYENRTNSFLVQVVEELKTEANERSAELKVVTIPDDIKWEISEYDGVETVEEEHRSWR